MITSMIATRACAFRAMLRSKRAALVRCGLFGASTYPSRCRTGSYPTICRSARAPTWPGSGPRPWISRARLSPPSPNFRGVGRSSRSPALEVSIGKGPAPESRGASQGRRCRPPTRAVRLDPTQQRGAGAQELAHRSCRLAGPRSAAAARDEGAARSLAAANISSTAASSHEVGRISDATAQFRRRPMFSRLIRNLATGLAESLCPTWQGGARQAAFRSGVDLSSDPTMPQQVTLCRAPFTGDYAAAIEAARDPSSRSRPTSGSA